MPVPWSIWVWWSQVAWDKISCMDGSSRSFPTWRFHHELERMSKFKWMGSHWKSTRPKNGFNSLVYQFLVWRFVCSGWYHHPKRNRHVWNSGNESLPPLNVVENKNTDWCFLITERCEMINLNLRLQYPVKFRTFSSTACKTSSSWTLPQADSPSAKLLLVAGTSQNTWHHNTERAVLWRFSTWMSRTRDFELQKTME